MLGLPIGIPKRQKRLAGQHALVDGIPFELPVHSTQSPALMAAFPMNADRAAALMPGKEIHPFRLWGNTGLFVVTVIDYRVTDIGAYIEYSLAMACTRGAAPAPPLLPVLRPKHYGLGQYVFDLPVSTEVSVKGGKGIWGMPKHQARLDFQVGDDVVSSRYEKDGQLAFQIDLDRPARAPIRLPFHVAAVNYCQFRGMLVRSYIYFKARISMALLSKASARITIGDHPRVQPLKTLEIADSPLFTAYMPETEGVLDDYFESWFLTHDTPPQEVPEGLESVVDLGRSEEWPPPPQRDPIPA
jgi:hypothetical protein